MPTVVRPGDPVFLLDGLVRFGASGSSGLPVFDCETGEELLLTAAHCVGALAPGWADGASAYTSELPTPAPVDAALIGPTIKTEPQTLVAECLVDAALVRPWGDTDLQRDLDGLGAIGRQTRDLTPEDQGTRLHKRGWTTGLTSGICFVTDIAAELTIRECPRQDVLYRRLFGILGDGGPFAEKGDSGAVVVDDNQCVVGMIIGKDGDLAYGVPIVDILNALNASL